MINLYRYPLSPKGAQDHLGKLRVAKGHYGFPKTLKITEDTKDYRVSKKTKLDSLLPLGWLM
jgi:hypothetical protein